MFGSSNLLVADMSKYQATGPNQHMRSLPAAEKKGWREDEFLFATIKSVFQVYADFVSC